MIFLSYIMVGLLTGILSGLLGIGGGILIVPALVTIFTWQHVATEYVMQVATATSLGAMIITTIMVTWSHNRKGNVRLDILRYAIPGMMIGVLVGVCVSKHLSTQLLSIAFALFTLTLGIKILWQAHQTTLLVRPLSPKVLFFSSLGIGVLSGTLGVGGGLLMVPLLLWYGLKMGQISGTSAACVLFTALVGTITAVIVGWNIPNLPPHSLGFVNWPAALILGFASVFGAPIGVYLVDILPPVITKRIFALLLVAIAIKMLVV